MKNFNDYAKQKRAEQADVSQNRGAKNEGSSEKQAASFNPGQGGAFEALNALAGKYEGASEEQLMRAIYAEAKRSRKNGTLSDEQIDEFVSTVLPMLSAEQAKKLSAVAQKIKNT